MQGLRLFTPQVHRDKRGFFCELFRAEAFPAPFVQDNFSFSIQGTLRGLHFSNQDKLVTCIQGKVFDVAVDIRPHSPTFGQWESVILDDETHQQFFIPKGFAHGFAVLSETARVHYKVSAYYDPQCEKSIRWNDPDLNIAWPTQNPILSERDSQNPYFKEVFHALDTRS